MPSEPSSKPYSLTTEEAKYVMFGLGLTIVPREIIGGGAINWEIALQYHHPETHILTYPLVRLPGGVWVIRTETGVWNEPMLAMKSTIGPFDTLQEAGATWQLMGCPAGSM